MNRREALRQAEKRLARAGIREGEAKNDAWLLLQHVTGIRRTEYFLEPQAELPRELQERFLREVEERATRRPLQYITGTQDFMGLTFQVNEHVLIPRQDTEILAERALEAIKTEHKKGNMPVRVLDLGTGSGCLAVSLAVLAKKDGCPVRVTASDLSEEALTVARANAASLMDKMPQETPKFCQGDLFDAVGAETFHVIVSNPPYIRSGEIDTLMPEVRDYEPRGALDGAQDGLAFYRRIAAEAPAHFAGGDVRAEHPAGGPTDGSAAERHAGGPTDGSAAERHAGGVLLLEIGFDEAEAVCGLLAENGFCEIKVFRDYAGLPRVVSGEICDNVKQKE